MSESLSLEEQRARDLGALVQRAMDPATAAVELARIERRHRTRQTALGAAVLLLALGGLIALTQTSQRPPHMALADGTTVHALSDDLDVVVRETHRATRFELAAGRARFDVAPRAQRMVRVVAGTVVVDVLGTRFDVQRGPEAVAVAVHAGQVRVRSPDGQFLLVAGARAVYPTSTRSVSVPSAPAPPSAGPVAPASSAARPERVAPASLADVPTQRPRPPQKAPRKGRPRSVGSDWQALARAGDYQAAMTALPARIEGVDALFLAADVARRAGDSAAAVTHLEAVLARHPGDARAPLAAFTLGRLATAPAIAARAFDRAYKLAPDGAMAADALARAAVAWQAAGDLKQAKARAKAALSRAPNGHRAPQLRAILAR